jgi:hypothetical protein
VRVPKIKKDLSLSKIEVKPICSIGLPKWQEKKLQKLSAEKLKEKGLRGFLKEVFKLRRMMLKQVVQQRQVEKEIQETIVKLEVYIKSSKSLVMASSILSAYAYMEFIP